MTIQSYRYLFPVLIAFIVIYFDTMSRIARTWSTYQGSHGPIILAISIYMIWTKKEQIKRLDIRPALFSGACFTIAGCFLLILGRLSSILLLQYLSLVVTMIGLVWLLWGGSYLKVLWYPIAYMIFMFPIFSEVLSGISIYLQTAAASIAFVILKLFGIPAFRSGLFIELSSVTLEVARECNGVNHIMALVSLAVPLAFWTQDSKLKKLILISSAFIIGVAANGIRVAIIGLWAVYSGNGDVHGPYDIFYVSFIFFFGMLALLTISSIMGRMGNKDQEEATLVPLVSAPLVEPQSHLTPVIYAVIILSATAGYLFLFKPRPVFLARPLSELPYAIGDWKGEDVELKGLPYSYFSADMELKRIYTDSNGHEIKLYIGYFPIQGQDREVVNYRFDPLHQGAAPFELQAGQEFIKIKKSQTRENEVIYFWYQINGRVLSSRYYAKIATMSDALLRRKTNAAIVGIGSSGTDAADFAMEFARKAYPSIQIMLN